MKTLLCISNSDCSGDTGIQADIKTSLHFKLSCVNALSCIITNLKEEEIFELECSCFCEQVHYALKHHSIDAIKIGMLYNINFIEPLKQMLSKVTVPVVLEPNLVSKSENFPKAVQELFAYVSLIAVDEGQAKIIFGDELEINSPCPVLVKNIKNDTKRIHRLFYANNTTIEFENELGDDVMGFSLSASIACNLALGLDLEKSIEISKDFMFNT